MGSYLSWKYCKLISISEGTYEKTCETIIKIDSTWAVLTIAFVSTTLYYWRFSTLPSPWVSTWICAPIKTVFRYFTGRFRDKSIVADSYLELLKDGKDSDLTLIVGPSQEKIACHQLILKTRSSVFRTMFSERWANHDGGDKEKREIKFPEIEPKIMQRFLKFLYADKFDGVTVAEALELYDLAHFYDVQPLVRKCEESLRCNLIKPEDAMAAFETAKKYGECELIKTAGQIMARSLHVLAKDENFMTMTKETLIFLLRRNDLALGEVELFKILVRWGRRRLTSNVSTEALREVLADLLPLIRFPVMTVSEFTYVVVPSGLLTEKTVIELYKYFSSAKEDRKILSQLLMFNANPRYKNYATSVIHFHTNRRQNSNLQTTAGQGFYTSQIEECMEFRVSINPKIGLNNPLAYCSALFQRKKKVAISSIVLLCPVKRKLSDKSKVIREHIGLLDVTFHVSNRTHPAFQYEYKNIYSAKEPVVFKHGEKIEIPISPPIELHHNKCYSIVVKEKGLPGGPIFISYTYDYFNMGGLKTADRADLASFSVETSRLRKNMWPGFSARPYAVIYKICLIEK